MGNNDNKEAEDLLAKGGLGCLTFFIIIMLLGFVFQFMEPMLGEKFLLLLLAAITLVIFIKSGSKTVKTWSGFFIVLFVFGIIFGSYNGSSQTINISEAEYGEEWPFTVSEGMIECRFDRRPNEVVLLANGTVYALNGKARGNKKYVDGWEIRRRITEYRGIPLGPEDSFDGKGLGYEMGDIIQRGLALCK